MCKKENGIAKEARQLAELVFRKALSGWQSRFMHEEGNIYLKSNLSQVYNIYIFFHKISKSLSFEAEPRVVRQHTKYKGSDKEQQTPGQQTFSNLMKDQRVIAMNPVQ